jgi:integrase
MQSFGVVPLPLSRLACDVLKEWKKEQGSESLYVFPSPRNPGKPTRSVKRAWRTALEKVAGSYFPIHNLRHVFCTRLSLVAPDAVVQRAMRNSSPETRRHYQLGIGGPSSRGHRTSRRTGPSGQRSTTFSLRWGQVRERSCSKVCK